MTTIRTQPVPILVPVHREQFLRREETRVRSQAVPLSRSDETIALHLNAVLMAEDLEDIHASAAEVYHRKPDQHHRAEAHDRYKAQATQLKLYHLGQLASLII